jgi:hypothetical protein
MGQITIRQPQGCQRVGEGSMAIAFIHEYLALTDTHKQGSA